MILLDAFNVVYLTLQWQNVIKNIKQIIWTNNLFESTISDSKIDKFLYLHLGWRVVVVQTH